ncbi:MAG: SagB/ThcOx family dehydrogenase [Alkalispirochaeta sp.]
MDNTVLQNNRRYLKSRWSELNRDETDQRAGSPRPAMQKDYAPTAQLVELASPESLKAAFGGTPSLGEAIANRVSQRTFSDENLSLDELAYLLWTTQGERNRTSKASFRTVPSGGARHPLETYLCVQRVSGLERGLYRYLPLDHRLVFVKPERQFDGNLEALLDDALLQHNFGAAVTFIWTAIPYRSEWSYGHEAARLILLDAGHVCQNLYLACESVSCGTCAVGAYDQQKTDHLLDVDGEEEFCVYAAPVGKKPRG